MRLLLILISFSLLAGCAKNTAEKEADAIDQALTHLTSEKCDEAIDVLEGIGRSTTNAIYLQTLASAYACRAGYNEVTFLTTEITKVNGASLLTSLTKLSTSPETEADSDSYTDLASALNLILGSTTGQPSQVARTAKFGARKAGDLGIQALFLSLTQLGKFTHFYGNVDSSGSKGKGAANVDEQTSIESRCFIDYSTPQAEAVITGLAGYCTNSAAGHPDLSLSPAELELTKKRMCQGLMLVTNIMDILSNLTLPTNSSFATIGTVSGSITTLKDAAIAVSPALATLISTTSQAECESLVSTPAQFENLQLIYAVLFEKGLP